MTRLIRTYSASERLSHPEFGIHDERGSSRIEHAHRHEYFQVQVNLAGETRHHIGAAARPLGPGDLSFVLPYRVHRVPHPPGSRFHVISFSLRFLRPDLDVDPLDLEDIALAQAPELAPFLFQEFMDFHLDGADWKLILRACARMAKEDARRRMCSLEIVRAHLLILLATVCQRYEADLLHLAAVQAPRKSRRASLARVARYVRDNLTGRVSLSAAAAAADLSPNYLAHLIKKETGRTFTDLVTERRMEKAQELLAHTGMRVAEVAEAVGFEDEAYFARRFKQRFTLAPRDYRRTAAAALR